MPYFVDKRVFIPTRKPPPSPHVGSARLSLRQLIWFEGSAQNVQCFAKRVNLVLLTPLGGLDVVLVSKQHATAYHRSGCVVLRRDVIYAQHARRRSGVVRRRTAEESLKTLKKKSIDGEVYSFCPICLLPPPNKHNIADERRSEELSPTQSFTGVAALGTAEHILFTTHLPAILQAVEL